LRGSPAYCFRLYEFSVRAAAEEARAKAEEIYKRLMRAKAGDIAKAKPNSPSKADNDV